jgi:hypothetical protein
MSSIQNSWMYKNLLDDLLHALDLQRQGVHGKRIGDRIADMIAEGIIRWSDAGKQPDGSRLAPLSRKYLLWKVLHGKNPAILHKEDKMMQFAQVKGVVIVASDRMSMFYGIDPDCIDKAYWTQEGRTNRGHGMPALFGGWFRPPWGHGVWGHGVRPI